MRNSTKASTSFAWATAAALVALTAADRLAAQQTAAEALSYTLPGPQFEAEDRKPYAPGAQSTQIVVPDYGKSGKANAGTLAVRAAGTIGVNPDAMTLLLSSAPPGEYIDAFGQPIGPNIEGVYSFIVSEARYRETVTASSNASAFLNFYYDRSTSVTESFAAAPIALHKHWIGSPAGSAWAGPDGSEFSVGYANADSFFNLIIKDLTANAALPVQSAKSSVFAANTSHNVNAIVLATSDSNAIVQSIDGVESRGYVFDSVNAWTVKDGVYDYPFGPGGIRTFFDDVDQPHRTRANYRFPFTFIDGHEYQFEMVIFCAVSIRGTALFMEGTAATCDASRSGYWNGLTSISDGNGNPLSTFSLIGESGFDFRNASPFSPAPAINVPEPASWALLIAGFGLVGVNARRRRTPRVAA